MELQLALDFVGIREAKRVLHEVKGCIDIAEVGTPFIVREGLRAVTAVRRAFAGLRILADLKIMDAGAYETRAAIEAGADIVTVLGAAGDATILAAVAEARSSSGSIMVDMIGVSDLERRAREIDSLGASFICVHTPSDLHGGGNGPFEELRRVKEIVRSAKLAVAGGITLASLGALAGLEPDIVVVGGGIVAQDDRRAAALEMSRLVRGRRG